MEIMPFTVLTILVGFGLYIVWQWYNDNKPDDEIPE